MTEQAIDFVIPYVNGNDPVWRAKKNSYSEQKEGGDDRDRRYREWNNLKYWFRGVERFAPWVRKVFLVTDHQAPEWLNAEYDKLQLVNHEDYIPAQYLPTFSSHPIELNFHRIPGVSEHFVYFNDDMFLTNNVLPSDFFRDGLPCDYAAQMPMVVQDRIFNHIIYNNILILNQHYNRLDVLKKHWRKFFSPAYPKGMLANIYFLLYRSRRFFGFRSPHLPTAFLKSAYEGFWEENYEWLDETCSHKFRNDNDVNQYAIKQYQYVNGLFTPYNWGPTVNAYQFRPHTKKARILDVARRIRKGRYKMICLNDAGIEDFETVASRLNNAFEALLPEKSRFEK